MELSTKCLLRERQILELLPVGRSSLWRWIKEGRFPKPTKLGPRSNVWRIEDVDAFVSEQLAGDDRDCADDPTTVDG